jgi:lipoprotein-releasing system permease protein
MRLVFQLAWRYFLSSKLPRSLNIVSLISVAGIVISAAALLIVLSVFNGFYFTIREMYQSFDAAIRIVPVRGRFLEDDAAVLKNIQQVPGVLHVSRTLEGKAILQHQAYKKIIQVKGIDDRFPMVSNVAQKMVSGTFGPFEMDRGHGVVTGSSIASSLSLTVGAWMNPLELFTVTEKGNLLAEGEQALKKILVYPMGYFMVDNEYDDEFVLCSINVARNLFEAEGKISAYELGIDESIDIENVKAALQEKLGYRFQVLTWYEQHETMNQIVKEEKRVGYIILFFMLLLISFNIIGSLSMVVFEKRADIGILQTLGANKSLIRNVFLVIGIMIGLIGGGLGIGLGSLLCWLQQTYGLLRFNVADPSELLIDAYPVALLGSDVILVFFTVLVLCLASAIYPAFYAMRFSIAETLRRA